MNKLYYLLGIGLLGAVTLSSCHEELRLEGEEIAQRGKIQTYTTVATIGGYNATENDFSTRASVQEDGSSFMWNKDDKVTIWSGTDGYEFTAQNYDETEPLGNVEFAGEGEFPDGATVWGMYPPKTDSNSEDIFTFKLSEEATQTASLPDLKETMHMLAKGTVNATTITNLKFEHLTSLFQFKITNRRDDVYKVKKVVVSCEEAIFPTTLTIAEDEKTYSDKVNSLTLNLTELSVPKGGETSYGYINFFPVSDITESTILTFTATIVKDGSTDEETIEKKETVGKFYNAESVVAKDGYQYLAGKRYGVSFNLITDLGYEITADNQYLVKNTNGLVNLASDALIMGNEATVITLDTDLDFQDASNWTPVSTEFKGTLNGNGKKILNITIAGDVTTGAGLFVTNSGTIKNLTLETVKITNTAAALVGGFAATNNGTIKDCTVNGTTLIETSIKTDIGAFVGKNNGTIEDCKFDGNSELKVTDGQVNLGGIVGANAGWVKGSSSSSSVKMTFVLGANNSALAGLVGWNQGNAKVHGSYSLATITLHAAASAGGLTGGSNNGHIVASYAAGSIADVSGSTVGGLVTLGGIMNGCYSNVTIINETGQNIGGIAGKSGNSQTASDCYFTGSHEAIGEGKKALEGATKIQISELISKIGSMNSNEKVTASGYKFVENNGTDKATVPLIVQKITD